MKIKVILPAKCIPDDTKVTKATGHKEYVIKRKLPLYGDGVVVRCDDDIMFLSSPNGINIIKENDLLAIENDIDSIIELLQEAKNETCDDD